MSHQNWMSIALEQAKIAYDRGEVPIGAVVVKDNQIIALAHNEKEQKQDPTAHAEVLAVQRATEKLGAWRLSEATLYVTLEPCPMCAGALVQARLSTLVYGASDLKGGAVGSVMNVLDFNRWNHRIEVVAGILEEECSALLKDFFRKKR